MAKKPEQLCNLEWVLRARSTDEARRLLTGVHATETFLAATDGHRLHVAPNVAGRGIEGPPALTPGTWLIGKEAGDALLMQEGTYPDFTKVLGLGADFGWTVIDRVNLLHLCRAAEINDKGNPTFMIALPTQDGLGSAVVRGDYLRAGLEGMNPFAGTVYLAAPKALQPIVLFQPESKRRAVVMPIRYAIDPEERAVTERWNIFPVEKLVEANTKQVEEMTIEAPVAA